VTPHLKSLNMSIEAETKEKMFFDNSPFIEALQFQAQTGNYPNNFKWTHVSRW
jgi:hypothetical protein